jgi:hypothetical protein
LQRFFFLLLLFFFLPPINDVGGGAGAENDGAGAENDDAGAENAGVETLLEVVSGISVDKKLLVDCFKFEKPLLIEFAAFAMDESAVFIAF